MKKNNPGYNNAEQENERQYQVIDQLLSMHASLRDKHRRWAFWLNTLLISISLFLSVFAFIGDDVLKSLVDNPQGTRIIIGFCAVFVLILSIAEFRVDWKEIGSNHAIATGQLSMLKAMYRKSFSEFSGNGPARNAELTTEYNQTMRILPPIPERYFLKLKASHQFKRNLSQRISRNPKAPVWFLRMQLRLQGIGAAIRNRESIDPGSVTNTNND